MAGTVAIYEPVVRGTAISFEWDPPSVDGMRRHIVATRDRLPWLVAVVPGPHGDGVFRAAGCGPPREMHPLGSVED